MMKHGNEDALAWGFIVLLVGLAVGGVMYMVLAQFYDVMADGPAGDQSVGINHEVKNGGISTQASTTFGFQKSLIEVFVVVVIILFIVYAINHARATRAKGGG